MTTALDKIIVIVIITVVVIMTGTVKVGNDKARLFPQNSNSEGKIQNYHRGIILRSSRSVANCHPLGRYEIVDEI